jgi:hypothetical protein
MAYLIWLLRGVPNYVAHLFAEYDYWKKRGKRGFIEFEFDNWQRLFDAIRFIEELPVYQDEPFVAMPGTPSYAPPGAKQLTLPLRKVSREVFDKFNGVCSTRRSCLICMAYSTIHAGRRGLYALHGEPTQTQPATSLGRRNEMR